MDPAAVQAADAIIVYGAGINVDGCQNFGKDVILFQRHRSGPVYLQYEVVSPRFLRQHTDNLAFTNITFDDVVTDSLDELTWRLRALLRAEEHQVDQDHVHRRHRRLGATGRRHPRPGQEGLGAGPADRHLRRSGRPDRGSAGRREGGGTGQAAGRRIPGAARHEAGNETRVRRQLLPAGPGLSAHHGRSRLPCDHHPGLHGDDHAQGLNVGLPDAEHAQRRRLPGLLRIRLRGHSVRHPAWPTSATCRCSSTTRPIRTTASSRWPTAPARGR